VDGDWQTMPAPPGGDTTNSDTALYVWRVTAPSDLAIVATGTVVASEQSGDTQTQTLVTGPMRDLALVVGPLQLTQRTVDGITLNAYLLEKDAEYTQNMLDYAEGQMPYPFNELDIVDAPGAFGGIEYPGEVFIGVVDGSEFFEVATVHEVGHQWFYSLIGDDQLLEPWLDEAAATYTEVLYDENLRGLRAASGTLDFFWNALTTSDQPDLPIGLAVADYPSENDYGVIVYFKGALFFAALRSELGDEIFFEFLHNYYSDYRYGFATSKDFQAVAEQTCACNLEALFDLWVYKGGTVPRP
jgi:aminopeptidase N